MLQHNLSVGRDRAHWAHAALVSMHTLCCGGPVLAMLLAAVAGTTSGVALLSTSVARLHGYLHAHEIWVLFASVSLVTIGGAMEWMARRDRSLGFPWLFAFSVLCCALNVAIVVAHRAI